MGRSVTAGEFLTTEEACRVLKVTRQTLYKLVDTGSVKGTKIGRGYRFTKEDLLVRIDKSSPQDSASSAFDIDLRQEKIWELRDNFSAAGIKKMAKRTFQELAANVEELIANAYDADATSVEVIIDQDAKTLSIIDDGNGMTTEDLEAYVVYGESAKTPQSRSPKFKRAPIGEYGMGGKLAISNISEFCKVVTRRDGLEHVFNMDSAQLDSAKYLSDIRHRVVTRQCDHSLHGTAIYMSKLRHRFVDADRLIERLSMKMPCSHNFAISVIVKQEGKSNRTQLAEPKFEATREFKFEGNLRYAGPVRLEVFFTREPIPATKQGIWTKVNGRIVNEKQEWFGLLNLHSGNRYRWRLYGYGYADGLKGCVTFSKNDFIDGPEYREYYEWVASKIKGVQDALLADDEAAARKREKSLVKEIEDKVNTWLKKLNDVDVQNKLKARIKEEILAEAPNEEEEPLELPLGTPIGSAIEQLVDKRDKSNRARRSLEKVTNQFSYKGKGYRIEAVDMSEDGDLVKLSKEASLIEVNDKHPLYITAAKSGGLDILVRDVALMEIARDVSEEDPTRFELIYNQLAGIAAQTQSPA